MDILLDELSSGLPQADEVVRVIVRIVAASLFGAVIVIQHEHAGKPAGVRTHMLVAIGCAMVVIACLEFGMGDDAMSRVVQGLVTGIGFIGGGAILKLEKEHAIEGLTTAGLERRGAATIGTVLALIILSVVGKIVNLREIRAGRKQGTSQ